ncbi:iron-containing alcohol dehydrogenase [Legionella jordanis]|nr:iron-containing alcohol dehydrogenase [Legionella jordanis]RMX05205.1 iron-containing alcohol dehydrogenase [Legionella jordanis]RMX20944.1 iron-containing alcohol dehydrogenase [Legionella jordanis]
MMATSLQANWNYPTTIRVGAGRAKELGLACVDFGMRKPLLVTDSFLATLPMTFNILDSCSAVGLNMDVFHDVKANPTAENVMNGVDLYHKQQHDGIIALGGGSALDAAKAIAFMVAQKGSIWDFEDRGDNWTKAKVAHIAKVIALPTTAGTGSEVGRASVITDSHQQVKKIIFHPKMLPSLVILDPELTLDLPANITAATGMDALSHCLEAYCAPGYHPMAEAIAMEGIRLIKHSLPEVVNDGHNLEARSQMLVASMMGATAFQRGLGAMHALAHPLGAVYDAHHGRLNAILMPYVLLANRPAIEENISRLASYLQLGNGFDDVLQWILSLRQQLKIEHSLSEIQIDERQVVRIAKMAVADPSAATNPLALDEFHFQTILNAAIRGECN